VRFSRRELLEGEEGFLIAPPLHSEVGQFPKKVEEVPTKGPPRTEGSSGLILLFLLLLHEKGTLVLEVELNKSLRKERGGPKKERGAL